MRDKRYRDSLEATVLEPDKREKPLVHSTIGISEVKSCKQRKR